MFDLSHPPQAEDRGLKLVFPAVFLLLVKLEAGIKQFKNLHGIRRIGSLDRFGQRCMSLWASHFFWFGDHQRLKKEPQLFYLRYS